MKSRAVIIDIDGTMADNTHRQHFLENEDGVKDWDSFFENEMDDSVNEWCRMIVDGLPRDVRVIFLTGRRLPLGLFHNTYKWLNRNKLLNGPMTMLLGRSEDDYRKDYVIKEEIYRNQIEPEFDILFAIDDRQQIVDMWRRIGITCLQCADHKF